MRSWLTLLLTVLAVTGNCWAAPLFGEVSGHRKPEREQRHTLEGLLLYLKGEIDSLSARLDHSEAQTEALEHRVEHSERLAFYGSVESRVTFQSFRNGPGSLDSMRSLNPGIAFDNLNYNAIVGAAAGAGGDINIPGFTGSPPPGGLVPPGQGAVIPILNPLTANISRVRNWIDGRPLTSGTGFTSRAILGLNIELTNELSAGLEFSAYSSQGNAIVDAYYGVQQPYLSNPSTTGSVNLPGLGPSTRATLDRFWLQDAATGTKLILGSYDEHRFNDSVYKGLWNPNEFGPSYLENYGFLLSGASPLDENESQNLNWQLMGTLLPDGSPGPFTPGSPGIGTNYFSHALGLKLGLEFHDGRGEVRFNALRVADEGRNGGLLNTGLLQIPNLRANMQWVNPDDFFINQVQRGGGQATGLGSPGDTRPVPTSPFFGADGSLAEQVRTGLLPQGVPNVGGIGPQQQSTWGLDFRYNFDHDWSPELFAEYARSSYRPNKNSTYQANGQLWRLGGNIQILDNALDLGVEYFSVDPRFSPFIIQMPTVARVSFMPGPSYHQNLYALHDVKTLPHNREGFRTNILWKFRPTGRIALEYEDLSQHTSSKQDVRFSRNSVAPGTPNTPVLGFSPGWIEPVFGPYHPATFAPQGSNTLARSREDEKGKTRKLVVKGGYKWVFDEQVSNRGLKLSGGVRNLRFERDSDMQAIGRAAGTPGSGTQAENQNFVDLNLAAWNLQVDYDVTEAFRAYAGITQVTVKGHYDPFNVSGLYAESVGTARFDNLNLQQTIPELGFEWELQDGLTWTARARQITLKDRVASHIFVNPTVSTLNIQNGPQLTHPFGWQGAQVTSQIRLAF